MQGPGRAVLSAGEVFHGKYEVRRCLQVGGMALVYEVVHRTTRRPHALKVLLPEVFSEPDMRERLELEARVTAGIESDHIVEVIDAGLDEATGSPFLVMELLRGEDLESLIRRRGPLAVAEVVALLSQAAQALDAVHRARIVHRDLKPSNLMTVDAGDRSPKLKVLDFGIAKIIADGAGARTTRNLGTPLYMSPEQAAGDGDIGPRADLYSLGLIAYTLLVGAPYWAEEQAAGGRVLFDSIESGAVEPATRRAEKRGVRLPEAFDAWFARATMVEPEERFETAGAMLDELAQALGVPRAAGDALPIAAPAPRAATRSKKPSRSRRALLASVAVAGVIGGASWWISRPARDASSTRTVVPPPVSTPAAASIPSPAATDEGPPPGAPSAPSRVDRTLPRRASARPVVAPPPAHSAAAPSPFGTAVY